MEELLNGLNSLHKKLKESASRLQITDEEMLAFIVAKLMAQNYIDSLNARSYADSYCEPGYFDGENL